MSSGKKYNLEFESLFMIQGWVAKVDNWSLIVFEKCNPYKIAVLKALKQFLNATSVITRD